jgi:dihydroorotase
VYDLVIKGGILVDPAQGIHEERDIAVTGDTIVAVETEIPSDRGARVLNAKNRVVPPGLIDCHVHCAHRIDRLSVPPDDIGVQTGVTTLVDCGSTGFATFEGFKAFVPPAAATDIFAYLHVVPTGLATIPENWGWYDADADLTIQTARENSDMVRGIKMRAIGSVIEQQGEEAIKLAKGIAVSAGLPLMVHVGIWMDEDTPQDKIDRFMQILLETMEAGDILTHIYSPNRGGIISIDGVPHPELENAIRRGVVLDVANGVFNYSYDIARAAVEKGLLPTTLSTDSAGANFDSPVVLSLTETMSKFMALGLSLDQVVEMTTINPARVLGEADRRGSVEKGKLADMTLLEVHEGEVTFFHRRERESTTTSDIRLIPRTTIKSGREIAAGPRSRML